MKKIFIFFMLVLICGSVKAQITDVYAGNDTLELRVGNYQYGFVQWQTARDTTDWIDIEGAIDTVYRFLPTKNAYYRARATFPSCPEVFSAVCYVQIPPMADAGPDRDLPEGGGATMFALLEEGCVGEWEIIEGENGSLSDLHDPNAYFEGTDSEYKLKWTVTNACGSASDTMTVKYYYTVMNDNYLVVDTTDFILSDSTQLLNGEYIIAFSEEVSVNDSILLCGVGDKPFLRKVVSYTYDEENGFYIFETTQGTLADFLKEGVFSFDLSTAFRQNRRVVISDRFPTRKDIAELGWNGVYYRQPKSGDGGLSINDKGKPTLNWTPGHIKLPWDFAVIPTLSMDDPNFLCEFKHKKFHVQSLKFGLYNTNYRASLQFYIPGKTSFTLSKKLPILDMPVALGFLFLGPIVTVPEITSDLTLSLTYSLGPEMSYFIVQNGYVSNYIMYDELNGWVKENCRRSSYDFDADWPDYGDLSGKVSLGLKLAFLIEDVLGPYAGFSLSFEGTHNTFGGGFTAEQFKIKEQFELGIKMQVLEYDLLDFNWPFVEFEMLNYQDPYSMEMVSGNYQSYTPGQQLPKPLMVKVKKSNGKPSKGVRVNFESNGAIHPAYTDDQGLAGVNWTPPTHSSGDLYAKANSYNVKNEPVQGSPVIFVAKDFQPGGGGGGGGGGSWGGPDCSTLAISAYVNGNGQLLPRASGGHPPYLFSKDGVSYGSSVFYIPTQGQTYHFYVKDSEGCVSDCYYTHPTQDCSSSTLNLRLSAQGSTLTAYASGGKPPYQYDLDGEGYSSVSVFYHLINGYHTVNVRDANGCVEVAAITLDAYGGGTGGGGTGGGTNSGSVTVTTSSNVEMVDATMAHGSGSVSIIGNATVSIVGLCWSRHHGPTTSDDYVQSAYSSNSFSNLMVNLTPNKMYYLRAYAVTSKGTVYGNEVGFSTSAMPPMVICSGVGNITSNSAKALGNVSTTSGTYVTERGFCWSTRHNPTIHDNHLACGSGSGAFSGKITSLTPETVYYLRAYAINSEGTSYSDEVSFETFEYTPNQSYTIHALASPSEGGRVNGTGTYMEGSNCTLTATANEGYAFVFWTENGEMISDDATYSFTVTDDRDLEAIFAVSSGNAPVGAINGLFSVGGGKQVYFSQGNLQYIGRASTPYWKFADHQWDYLGDSGQGSDLPNVDRDLFGWGTSGYNHGAVCYQPWSVVLSDEDYYAYGNSNACLFDQSGQADWGFNSICNGGNHTDLWRTLTNEEWYYMVFYRTTASGILYTMAQVDGVNGMILLPDDWQTSYYSLNISNSFSSNVITASQWITLERHGAVFLPASGTRLETWVNGMGGGGEYWSASVGSSGFTASAISFGDDGPSSGANGIRGCGFSVRLVRDAPSSATLPQIQSTEVLPEGTEDIPQGAINGLFPVSEGH